MYARVYSIEFIIYHVRARWENFVFIHSLLAVKNYSEHK